MNVPLIAAGSLALLAAAIHGIAGERLVVRRLAEATLPRTRFGGPEMTLAMVHVAWHLTTVAFLTVGVALLLAGTVLDGDAAEGLALLAAGASTGFGLIALGLAAAETRFPRSLIRHPGPVVLTLIPVLAWWGAV